MSHIIDDNNTNLQTGTKAFLMRLQSEAVRIN